MKKVFNFVKEWAIAIVPLVIISVFLGVVFYSNSKVVVFENDSREIFFQKVSQEAFELRDNFPGLEYGQKFSQEELENLSQQLGWQQVYPRKVETTGKSSFFFKTAYAVEKKKVELFIGKTEHRVNGVLVKSDVAPFLDRGRTMVPLRFVGEAFGFKVEWEEERKRVVVSYENTGDKVILTIGSTTATVNGAICPLDVPPRIVGGRTFVPIRFIVEAFGAKIADVQQHYHPTLGYPMGVSKVTIEMLY